MKKRIICIAIIIWIATMVIITVGQVKRDISDKEYSFDNKICMSGDVTYASETVKDTGYLYKIDGSLNVIAMADTLGLESMAAYEGLAHEAGTEGVYAIIQTLRLADDEYRDVYRIVRYNKMLEVTGMTGLFAFGSDERVSGLLISEGTLYVVTVSSNGDKALLYEMESRECINDMTSGEKVQTDEEETDIVEVLYPVQLVEAEKGTFIAQAQYKDRQLAVRTDREREVAEFNASDTEIYNYENKNMSIRQKIRLSSELIQKNTFIMLCGIIIIVLISTGLYDRNRIVYMTVTIEIMLAVMITVGGIAFYKSMKNTKLYEQEEFYEYYLESISEEVNRIADMEGEDQYADIQEVISEFMDKRAVSDRFVDMCMVRVKDSMVLASAGGKNYQEIDRLYTSAAKELAMSLTGGKAYGIKNIMLMGRPHQVMGVTVQHSMTPQYAFIGIIKQESFTDKAISIVVCGIIAFFMASAIFTVYMIWQIKDLKNLEAAMQEVAKGKSDMLIPHVYGNDMKHMWNSLHETDKNIKNVNYSRYRIYEAYFRFAPKNIDKILKKESIMEVNCGDLKELTGTLALLSFSKETKADMEAVKDTNRLLSVIEKHQKENEGIFISGDSNLSLLRMLFMNEAGKTVEFGLNFLHELQRQELYDINGVTVFLHYSDFLYGVAGTDTQCFPFLQSKENEQLEQWARWLREMQLKFVVTKEVADRERIDSKLRYIGHISLNGRTKPVGLYEILDACTDAERSDKLRTLDMFQEALDLFYKRDFYLARSKFTEIFKLMPYDEISKWYIFTCEGYLNETHAEGISFGLN